MAGPPPILSEAIPQGLTRRAVLRAAGIGGLLVGGGALLYRGFWVVGPPGPGRRVLSTSEYDVAKSVAQAFFPGPPFTPLSAEAVGLADFVDGYIADLYEDNQRLFKLLLGALNVSTLLTHGSSFIHLSVEERRSVLEGWRKSRLLARRAAIQSLRFVHGMGYFEDFRVRRALGLSFGCDLSSQFPEMTLGGP